MLGFERKEPFVLKGKFAEEFIAMLERMRTGNYNQSEVEALHERHVTPKYRMVFEGETKDEICEYCDRFRRQECPGRDLPENDEDCPDFTNHFDIETCGYCKFAKEADDDEHVMCPKKGERMNKRRWCINFEKR